MAWLTSLLKKPEVATAEETQLLEEPEPTGGETPEEELPPAPAGPQLAVLAPDVAGISSFKLSMYPSAAAASAEIEAMHPEMRRGTHAFWALHDEPALPDDAHREALVLIRANHTSNVVYVVSFVDLESAWSFARFEAKRGLDVSHLIILWAAFATVREELDGVSILPPQAPRTRSQGVQTLERPPAIESEPAPEPEEERLAPPQPESGPRLVDAVETPAPAAPTDDEAEAVRRAEAAREQAEEAARIAHKAQEELQAARAAADAARIAEEKEREEIAAREQAESLAELETQVESDLQPGEARREEPVVLDATSTALDGLTETLPPADIEVKPPAVEPPASAPAPAPTRSYPGDEESFSDETSDGEDEPEAVGTVFMHSATVETAEEKAEEMRRRKRAELMAAGDPTAEFPETPDLDEFDIAYEVERLLKNRRFDKREEPFKGFESPPGRF